MGLYTKTKSRDPKSRKNIVQNVPCGSIHKNSHLRPSKILISRVSADDFSNIDPYVAKSCSKPLISFTSFGLVKQKNLHRPKNNKSSHHKESQ